MENKTEEQKIIEYLNKVIYTGINKKAKCRKRATRTVSFVYCLESKDFTPNA